MNDRVPSIGSMIQQYSASGADRVLLLADDAVLWITLHDQFADRCFGRSVGLGNGVETAGLLVFDSHCGAKTRQRLRLRSVAQLMQKGFEFLHRDSIASGGIFPCA